MPWHIIYMEKKYFKGFKSEFPELVSNISKYFKIFGFIVCRSGGFQGQQHQADLHIVQHCAGFIVQDCAALVVLQSSNDAANGVAKISQYLAICNSKSIFFSLIKYRVTLLIFLCQISLF